MAEAADKVVCPSVEVNCSLEVQGDECNEIKWWSESLKQSKNFRRDVAALISPNTSAVLMLGRNMKLSEALANLDTDENMVVHTTINSAQDELLTKLLKRRSRL